MCTKTKIINKFKSTVKKYDLIRENDTIIVGASGGPDSQFLIYLLNEVKDFYKINIVLAHLNHMHRADATNDEKLVIETGKNLSFETFVERKSMDTFAKEKKISSEHAGRILRYEFFRSIKNKYKNPKIAVAHNKDDQAETVLMRIIRGTGLDGLRAMDYKNEDIIRPIMDFSKGEILEFLDENKISYHIDYTNLETDYTRNKIRLEIIPDIEKINPNFKNSLVSLSEIAKNDYYILREIEDKKLDEIIRKKDKNYLSFDKSKFDEISDPLKARLIRRAIEILYGNINDFSKTNIEDFLKIESLSNGKKIIKDDLIFEKNYRSYDFYINNKNSQKKLEEIFMKTNDEKIFGKYKFKTSLVSYDYYKNSSKKNKVFYSFENLDDISIKIRYRVNGDYFTAMKDGKRKKLKNFFIDEKIDKNLRDEIPLLFINDKLSWIVNLRRSEDFKVKKNDDNILMVSVEDI
ncbi:MAG: tRNA lysidine(34) synthetase TilS [Anaerococcus vaginalis]|nr:tRNA lysidine(34) synthetase TilS [Anaerococcus vaginalis]